MKKYELSKAKSEAMSFFSGRNEYDVQNELIHQYKFPSEFHRPEEWTDGDMIASTWSDHIHCSEKYREARMKFFGDTAQVWDGVTRKEDHEEKTIGFLNMIFKDTLEQYGKIEIDGYRIVRYTNVSNGYPTYRFDVWSKHPDTPEKEVFTGQEGDNVEYPDFTHPDSGRYLDF